MELILDLQCGRFDAASDVLEAAALRGEPLIFDTERNIDVEAQTNYMLGLLLHFRGELPRSLAKLQVSVPKTSQL